MEPPILRSVCVIRPEENRRIRSTVIDGFKDRLRTTEFEHRIGSLKEEHQECFVWMELQNFG